MRQRLIKLGKLRFLSTLSLRRATEPVKVSKNLMDNFYPRSPCGERQRAENHANSQQEFLSTLSLRRATGYGQYYIRAPGISIHALLAESDGRNWRKQLSHHKFLSTLSLRRATGFGPAWLAACFNFYPRSPCGERRVTILGVQHRVGISIHALLAESDKSTRQVTQTCRVFLSTLSLRRATIHTCQYFFKNFEFLSTLSLRRATARRESRQQPAGISIHALLAESDTKSDQVASNHQISIHALLAESDDKNECTNLAPKPFLSTLSLRRATPHQL